jgi:predicted nuclease of predicted toxin-antitoxin system
MKILLDENIDVRFKNYFANNHEVFTVKDMGWNGVKNGELLILLKKNNFNAWIVVDKNIPYQQNINNLPCLIIVLDIYRNTLKHLLTLIPKIMEVLNNQEAEKIVIVS